MLQLNVGAMDAVMKQKIDEALARVKEPESDLSIAQPGVVEKLRYSAGKKSFTFLRPSSSPIINTVVPFCREC